MIGQGGVIRVPTAYQEQPGGPYCASFRLFPRNGGKSLTGFKQQIRSSTPGWSNFCTEIVNYVLYTVQLQ